MLLQFNQFGKDIVGSILFGGELVSEEKSKIIGGCWKKLFDNKDVIQKSHGYIIIRRF